MKVIVVLLALGLHISSYAQTPNPNNPYDKYGAALRQHVLAANNKFKNIPCRNDKRACWEAWGDTLDKAYHKDKDAYVRIDTTQIRWTQKEDGFRRRIANAMGNKDYRIGMDSLTTIENDITRSYSQASENQKALFLLATNAKYMLYAIYVDGISAGPGSGDAPSAISYHNCMVDSINNTNVIDILINWTAGPGGWVLGASINCLVR